MVTQQPKAKPNPVQLLRHAIAGDKVIFIALAFAAVVTMGLLGFLDWRIRRDSEAARVYSAEVEQSVASRTAVRSVLFLLRDLEGGERGYVLSGHPEFLQSYEAAVRAFPARIEAMVRSARGTPMEPRALILRDAAVELASSLRSAVEARKAGDAGADHLAASLRNKAAMDRFRDLSEETFRAMDGAIDKGSSAARGATAHFESFNHWLILVVGSIALFAPFVVALNIGQRQVLAENLREARLRAEQASQAKSEFLATMSHEIRTPLNGVIGYTELLLEEHVTPPQRRYLERARFAGQALLSIVNDVLDFSRLEAGRLTLAPQRFELEALIDNVVSLVRTDADRKGLLVSVYVDRPAAGAYVGDHGRLRQILLNLLSNAVKFTEAGTISLVVKAGDSPGSLHFAVEDTGSGIPAERQSMLFQRFSRGPVDTGRDPGGTGLGLAICKKLVDLMGGRIGMRSTPGAGSTFWFEVPLITGPADGGAVPETASLPASAGRPGRVLLVEDLEFNRELARVILEKAGHAVDLAGDGRQAVESVRAATYDLVLMDIHMPVMDGIAATREIRGMAGLAGRIPIVAMTANVLPHQVEEFMSVGMNDHIGKPFGHGELLRKVQSWIARGPAEPRSEARPDSPPPELQEWRDLMGTEWTAGALNAMVKLVDEIFAKDGLPGDPISAARLAHALISRASVIGFHELAARARDLEEACLGHGDLEAPYERAREAARAARERAQALLAAEEAVSYARAADA